MNIKSQFQLHMDLHLGDDSPDPISQRAFNRAVDFVEDLHAKLIAAEEEIKKLKLGYEVKILMDRLQRKR